MSKIKIEYVDHMGDDLRVVNSARISMGKDSDILAQKDKKLINYLAKHKHYTPFEHCTLSVIVHCPLYIRSQIHRHRTFSYNEISRRYTSEGIDFYEPTYYRKQHEKSKQCSSGNLSDTNQLQVKVVVQKIIEDSLKAYNQLLEIGVAREQARAVLPQSLMTRFYMTGNLRNWMQFLILRLDNHSQEEVRDIAQPIYDLILEKFPVSGKALLENLK